MPNPQPRSLERSIIEDLIYGPPDAARRYTQDSPILPDVWMQYGASLDEPQDLLLTPFFGATAGDVARHLRDTLAQHRKSGGQGRADPDVAYNRTYVATRLYFDELICLVLPLTGWWVAEFHQQGATRQVRTSLPLAKIKANARFRNRFVTMLEELDAEERGYAHDRRGSGHRVSTDVVWMVRLAGTVAWARDEANRKKGSKPVSVRPTSTQLIASAAELFSKVSEPDPATKRVWLVNLNREARTAMRQSVLAVKADAARFLFKVRCSDLAWGIIDNGIDARHPALWNWSAQQASNRPESGHAREWTTCWTHYTRVKATYDFTRIRQLLDPSKLDEPKSLPGPVRAMLRGKGGTRLRDQLGELKDRLLLGRGIDWDLVAPFLQVPHNEHYIPPTGEHGTHVSGILAADWPEEDIHGVCPDINLYDLRVMEPGGANDEFAVLAALQFVAHLNDQKDFYAVHGVNISLAIRHEVANFACGRTPVCDECERLVASGVTVVAAAGKRGLHAVQDGARGERGVSDSEYYRSGQCGEGHYGRRDPPVPASHLRRELFFEPWPHRRWPAASPTWLLLARRSTRTGAGCRGSEQRSRRHQHGGAACQRGRGDVDGALHRSWSATRDRIKADPVRHRDRSGPRTLLPGRGHAPCAARAAIGLTATGGNSEIHVVHPGSVLKAKHGDALMLVHYGTRCRPKLHASSTAARRACGQDEPGAAAQGDSQGPERGATTTCRCRSDADGQSHRRRSHLVGVLDMFERTSWNARPTTTKSPKRAITVPDGWHNSFDDVVGDHADALLGVARPAVAGASAEEYASAMMLVSVPQGRELRNNAKILGLGVNEPVQGVLAAAGDGAALAPPLAFGLEPGYSLRNASA